MLDQSQEPTGIEEKFFLLTVRRAPALSRSSVMAVSAGHAWQVEMIFQVWAPSGNEDDKILKLNI